MRVIVRSRSGGLYDSRWVPGNKPESGDWHCGVCAKGIVQPVVGDICMECGAVVQTLLHG